MENRFIKKFQNFIFQEKILKKNDKLIIGISGGADSVGLTLALEKLKLKYNLNLHLVHINYHQRNQESNEDQKFVEKFAKKNNLNLTIFDYRKDEKGNLEELLRDFRYQKFKEIRKKLNFDKIAVAHHLDDQIETFFMNLIRGSGAKGLTGMAIENNYLIRPFLIFSKKEIENFLKENKQSYRLDKTNLEANFNRNKIRLKLIPFLEKNFNPNIKEGLVKMIINLKDEVQSNDFLINQIYPNLTQERKDKIVLNILKLKKFPAGVQKKIFREIILKLKGDLKNISNNNFLEFKKIIESQKNKKQKMKIGKISLEKNKKCVTFIKT